MKKVPLANFIENPNNPQTITEEAFANLVNKISRNINGLKADRIAYVVDEKLGKNVVLSGNKRLRALKKILGDDAKVDASYFQDISSMDVKSRREFIVNANVNEGKFDPDKMLKLYSNDELKSWMGEDHYDQLLAIAGLEGRKDLTIIDDVDEVELRIKLSSNDYESAVVFLRLKGGSMESNFMRLIRDHGKRGKK